MIWTDGNVCVRLLPPVISHKCTVLLLSLLLPTHSIHSYICALRHTHAHTHR